SLDETFRRARDQLRSFEGIAPADPPREFKGSLRGYQREGLGWLLFLESFGFGGCLADDMGLGKTVQVLALLESRRELRAQQPQDRPGPSLVVVPRSLVFNWMQEAARFTPQLRVLDHTGADRVRPGEHFDDYDLILTTYGTLRRDALHFKDVVFDYCILDESQAIKNAGTESSKATRLLRAHHRLALSGTPVENHLGELWSLFEFLNPGMLGTASVFRLGGAGARNPEPETRALLAKALRPFILRRTKEKVARDLPEKLEQTLFCELEAAQRKQYDELREHYRATLLDRVSREGINKAKIQILEALLRLRQAACHPGLIDKSRTNDASAKLDLLLPQIAEVVQEGHKVLVFSQFTSLLAIVRERLDQEGITYEYLDGKTRKRADKVERFQSDPDCKLFLISLKAGGLGLNLTAAEYVFLLDPWWNPAVEAQAIDRAHRIGQTRNVFAYRLIARDTVEEKVLELQKTKRDLADSIINADNSLIRNLGKEDLELLLS
ncbi:MAG: DEAD/DEAH box helicase, partial [Planctomycetes bacterium]|nr:DEAD/DEAH box helicase [Planctomycetota bacterium]